MPPQWLTKNIRLYNTGLPRASLPTRHAVRAVRLWPEEHTLRAFLRRPSGTRARPPPARLGKRRELRRRLGRERADKRRQARTQQGQSANGTTRARARRAGARRPRRLVCESAEYAQSRGAGHEARQWRRRWPRCWRGRTRWCWEEEGHEDSDWEGVEERRSASI
jgi:hypothetical protein